MRQILLAVAAIFLSGAAYGQASVDTARIETHLEAFDSVRFSESQLAEAQTYLETELQQMGYEVGLVTSTRSGAQGSSDSISARIPGSEHTCIVAHYDTVSGSPGVADNGAAVAVLLEIARIARGWTTGERGVVFLFSTFEENGLQGSNDWLAAAENSNLCDRAISLDSIGWECTEPGCAAPYVDLPGSWCSIGSQVDFEPECSGNCTGTHVTIASNTASMSLAQSVGAYIGESRQVVTGEVRGFCSLLPAFRRSDHANFWDDGIPAVLISTGATDRSSCYHGGSDTRACPEWSMDIVIDIAQSTLNWLVEDLDAAVNSGALSDPLSLGDFDGDQKFDALVRDTDGTWDMTLLDGFIAVASGTPPINSNLDFSLQAVADFNGDGKDDVLLRHGIGGSWRMFLMDGLARIGVLNPLVDRSHRLEFLTAADFNGDGRDDLLLFNLDTNDRRLFLLDGFEVLSVGNLNVTTNPDREWIGFPDLDGDGDLDLVTRHKLTGVWRAYLLDGLSPESEGRLQLPRSFAYRAAHTGDFDDDGDDDILLHNVDSGGWELFLMNGLTVESVATMALTPGDGFQLKLVGDFDGSGTPDLLFRNTDDGGWYLSLMNGTSVVAQGVPPVSASWEFTAVAASDFDGDGKDDILLRHTGYGSLRLFLMDGLERTGARNLPFLLP